jgi:DNA-binding transcriptional regulator YiaG
MAADGMKVDKIAHYLNVSAQMVQKWIDESMSVAH